MVSPQSLLGCAIFLALSVETLHHAPEPLGFVRPRDSAEVSAGSRLGGSASNEQADQPSVPPDHAFYDNYKKNFSWFDPVQQQALFGVAGPPDSQLKKRTGGPPSTGPVLPNTDCLGCDQAAQGQTFDFSEFTVEYFIDNALWAKGQGRDQCVFYSPAYGSDLTRWENAFGNLNELNPENDGSYRLSAFATTYACSYGMKAIWTTWPGQSADNPQSGSTHYQYNYWEIFKPGSWNSALASDSRKWDRFAYFSHMSQALAEICTGDIYVMSIDPLNLASRYSGPNPKSGFPSILTTVELSTLLGRSNQGDQVNRLFAIDAVNTATIYQLNWNPQYSLKFQLTPREVEEEHGWVLGLRNGTRGASVLTERAACNANLAYETYDWFG